MKKFRILLLLVVLAGLLFTGCSQDYMRNLKIINNTEDEIISSITIRYYVTEPRKFYVNALLDNHTIDPQESMDFKLAPYPEEIYIVIQSYKIDPLTGIPAVDEFNAIIYSHTEVYVYFENIVPGRRKVIEATFVVDTSLDPDVYDIELGGDGYLQSTDSFSSQPPDL